MSADTAEHALAPELEAVATAAERQLRALASEEPANADHLGQALADADSNMPAPRSHASCSPGSSVPPDAGARQNTTFTRQSPAPPDSDSPTATSPRPRTSRTAPSARSSPAPTATPHPHRPSPS